MGVNVLFLYPNTYGMNMLPPAIALFSALLKQRGHQISVFDSTYYMTDYGIDSDGTKSEFLNVVPFDMSSRGIKMRDTDWRQDLRKQVEDFSPDLIAMSSTEDMWGLGCFLLEEISDIIERRDIPVIAGGVFPTFAPDIAISHRLVDMVCVGEGEQALIELCDRLEKGHRYDDVTNLWVKMPDGHIMKNFMTMPVDINENPIIDISIFEDARLYRPMSGRVYRMLPIETHRGCPYTCTYCNSPSQNKLYREATGGSHLRKKSFQLVHDELKFFKENYDLEYAYFWADTFLALNGREFDEFIEMYSDIKLPFWMQTRPETLSDDKVRRLAEVGLHRVSFGIEHGNEDFRRRILDRRWKNDDIVEALKLPHRYNVQYSVNNITGFPTETREIAMDTVELNRLIDADNHNLYSFVPFHGIPLRQMVEEMGYLSHGDITRCATDRPVFQMEQYPESEIMGLRKCFVLYIHFPRERWNDIRKAEADTPEGRRIFLELREEFMDKYFAAPKDNPNAEMPKVADLEYGIV